MQEIKSKEQDKKVIVKCDSLKEQQAIVEYIRAIDNLEAMLKERIERAG